MSISLRALFLCSLAFAFVGFRAAQAEELCGRFVTPDQFKWSTSEKRTLCGSADTPSWQNIPFNQAEFFFRSFLQSRGYHTPAFEIRGEKLYVRPGKLTLVSRIRSYPERADLNLEKYWLPIGKPLNPEQLNNIEKWMAFKLGRLGYACPKFATKADKTTGDVMVQFESGQHWTIEKVNSEHVPGVDDGMLDRYRAFDIDDPYDPVVLEISANRLLNSQTVINSQYSPECAAEQPGTIRQTTLPGEPRLLSFGFGFDSENLAIAKASWSNSRFTRSASLLQVQTSLSYREQEFLTTFNWYYLPWPSNHYLKTYIKADRDFEANYETRTVKAVGAPAYATDFRSFHLDMYAGPSLQFEKTIRGEAPSNTRLLTLDMGLNVQDHMYEYYIADPQQGFQGALFGSFSNKSVVSDVSLAQYKANFTYLWNILNYEPTIWILGLRGTFVTTQPGKDTTPDQVPASFKQFLGGSDDMRGFARKDIPSVGTGVLTKVYGGLELRLNNKLPYNLQPLIFTDYGQIGNVAFKVDPIKFWSPGVGLRWQSPIGTIRVSVAHGYVTDDKLRAYQDRQKYQFYFSLGEQF